MSQEPPISELLAYLGGLGYTELYRRGERREKKGPEARPPGADTAGAHRPGTHLPGPRENAGPRSERVSRPAAAMPDFGPPAAASSRRAEAAASPAPGIDFSAAPGPALPLAERSRQLELLRQQSLQCRQCRLCRGRTQVVFGSGPVDAELMLIGEGPGAEEDRQGLPFVGAAGELLTKIIQAIELDRSQVYIANVVKCRPPENRDPDHDEIDACLPYLLEQIDLVRPRLIVALGRIAARTLLHTAAPLNQLRGEFYPIRGAQMRVTYHPAALLRDESLKRPTWEDMKTVRDRLRELREQGPKP